MSPSPVPPTPAPQKGAPAPAPAVRPKSLRWETAWNSDPGLVRTLNEDAIQGTLPEHLSPGLAANRGYLFIVADGMGGHNAGEVASNQSLQRIYKRYYADPDPDLARSLEKAIRTTNAELYREAKTTPGQQGMGTTLTAAVIKDNHLHVGHVGDSRLYLIRNGQPEQVTQDDSWVEEQVRAGVLTRLQAESHPQRNVITRALATGEDVKVASYDRDLQPGDVIVMCSDGLNTEVGDQQIASHATKSNTPKEAVDRLIQLARDNGGEDNISLAVIRFSGEAAPGAAAVPAAGTTPEAKPKRRRLIVPIVAALALVLVVGGAAAVYFLGPFPPQPQPTVIAQNTVSPPAVVVLPTSTLVPAAGTQATLGASALGTPTLTATQSASAGNVEPTSTLIPSAVPPTPKPQATSRPTAGIKATNTSPSQSLRQAIPPSLGDPSGSTETRPTITFFWKSNETLQPNEGYAVLCWAEGQYSGVSGLDLPTAHSACGELLTEEKLTVNDITRVCNWMGPGRYNWTVVVVNTTRPDGKGHSCSVISDQPSPHQFTYSEGGQQAPPP